MAEPHMKPEPASGDGGTVIQDHEAKLRLQYDLREVCAAKGFDLEYQPQVNLCTGLVTNFEALLRWRHPVRGNVPPSEFIPLAQEIGLIVDIDQWVLKRACREATGWPEEVGVAVNVSAMQLADVAFPAIVAAALRASGLAPSRLELEVTETESIPNNPNSLAILREIRKSGVGIVIDDFDIGYSALGYLIDFPITKIKIDRSFIDKLARGYRRHEAAITVVRSIIRLCKELGISCLAEGVETEEQLATLMEADCTEIQGYLLGRPQPFADTLAAMENIPPLLRGMHTISGHMVRAIQKLTSQSPSGRSLKEYIPYRASS